MTNDELRAEVRLAKARYRIPYKDVALRLSCSTSVFYNWLREEFNYSEKSCAAIEKALQAAIQEVRK